MEDREHVSRESIFSFRRDGFHCLPQFFSKEEVAEMRRVFTRATRDQGMRVSDLEKRGDFENRYHRMVVQLLNLWRDYEEIRPFVLNPNLAEIARRLIGSRSVRLFHDQALIKAPRTNTETPWHRDSPNLPLDPPHTIVCWIALDDVSERNGALQYLPGSHRFDCQAENGFLNPKPLAELEDFENIGSAPITLNMKAGGCSFHHSNLLHRGGANKTARPRRALSIIYLPQGARFNGSAHPITDCETPPINSLFRGRHYPLLSKGW